MKMASCGLTKATCFSLAIAALGLFACPVANAIDLYWSANGTTQGGGLTGAAAWTTTNAHWSTSAAGPFTTIWNNANGDSAIFGGTAGATVNINDGTTTAGGTALTVNSIRFDTSGWSIGNGNAAPARNTINFTGTTPTLNTAALGTITMTAVMNGTITKTGVGRLEFGNGSNPNTNKYILNGGVITTASISRLSAAPAALVQDYLTFDGGGWAINTGSQTTGNRGVTLKAGGAFFGTSANSIALTIDNPIVGTEGGGITLTNAGPFTGNGSVTGGGNVVLTAINTYDGPTTINGSLSTLTVDSDATLGNGTGTLTLNGGKLVTSATRAIADVIANPINMTANSTISTTSTAANVNFIFSSNTVGGTAGTLTLVNNGADAATDVFDPRFTGSGFNFSRPIDMPDGLLASKTRLSTFNVANTTNTFSGVISGTGSFRRSATSPDTGGDTVLSGLNTYSGGTLITGGGIGFGSSTDAPTPTKGPIGTGTLTVNNSSASLYASGGSRVVSNPVVLTSQVTFKGSNDLEMSGTVALGAVNRTITVTNTGITTLSGVISDTGGTGGITKSGAGVLILKGANTYGTAGTTGTTVTAGTLLVNNSTGSGTGVGNVSVTGGTLGGSGSISGSVSVNGGTLSPGNSPGALTIGGSLSLIAGSYKYQIDTTPTATADLTSVAGDLNITPGAVTLDTTGSIGSTLLAMGTKFTLINYGLNWNGGTFIGLPNYDTSLTIGVNRFQIIYDDISGGSNFGGGAFVNNGNANHWVTITAVPEASTFLTIGLGGIFAVAAVWMTKRMGINVLKV